jgi:predicted nucleic acid-binding protein
MERSEEVIIDASVAIKWFSEEEGSERALAMRSEHIEGKKMLVAPDLLIYEVANALKFKPGLNLHITTRAVNDLFDLQVELMLPSRELTSRCSQFAFKYGITVYDSCYLALGELLGLKVITADNYLYKRARGCGFLQLL